MKLSKPSDGFSLIEVVMAISISLTIIAAVYQLSFSQQRTYRRQDQTVENRQNLRAIMALMTKNIQLAGYDPTGQSGAGIVTNFDSPHDGFLIDYTSDDDIIAFTIDYNAELGIEPINGDGQDEQVAFRLQNNNLEKYDNIEENWNPIASNIDVLNFVFLDNQGNPTTNIADFRAVEISLLVRSTKADNQYTDTTNYTNKQGAPIWSPGPNDHYRRRLLSKTIHLRNIGLN